MEDSVVQACFISAFLLDIAIAGYAVTLSRKMGRDGILSKVTIYSALSAFVFGLHHLMELFLTDVPHGIAIAESIEAVAAVFLGMAVYQLFKLTRELHA